MQPQTKQNEQVEEYGKVVGPATVRIERVLSASPETVWAYLTESEKCAQWLASIDGDVKEGGTITMTWLHKNLTPHNEQIPEEFKQMECGAQKTGTVLIYDPPRTLSYTWGNSDQPSEVTFKLTPQGKKTLLALSHSKLPSRSDMLGVSTGWHAHLSILRDKLEGKTPEPFWPNFLKLREAYDHLIKGE